MCFSAAVRRSSMVLAVMVSVLVCAHPVAADATPERSAEPPHDGGPSVEALQARIAELAARDGAEAAAGRALQHARRAVERARALHREGDVSGARRARQIAAAALSWAHRRVAVVSERAAHRMARERLARARERLSAAETALRHAERQRDEVLEGETASPQEQASRDGEAP